MREAIRTDEAPAAIGPYSQAIRAGGFLFCSGQIALAPATGELAGSDAPAQARRALANLAAVCRAGGAELSQAARVTVYLTDLASFQAVNEVFAEFFPGDAPPARVTVGVASLPRGAQVEIDAIVALEA